MEARKEAELMRSWSLEKVDGTQTTVNLEKLTGCFSPMLTCPFQTENDANTDAGSKSEKSEPPNTKPSGKKGKVR